MKNILSTLQDVFGLSSQRENFSQCMQSIESGIPFKGTNLWILIFAIFIASLGLNVNSTAVIIGAMLISPLMGPIIGIGFSVGVNHPNMLKLSLKNYTFSFVVALVTSTIYFLISPLSEAHSEILARTSPTIYDVFIAFFGGAAGMLANGSKVKGNVIPGVAIATALMPPICTAGYGLATGQFSFFFGAIYLFLINTVYIAVSTFLMVKVLNYPSHHYIVDAKVEKRSQKIMWALILFTLIPSIYFGYVMIKKYNFEKTATQFITNEAVFPNNFLLEKNISYENNEIQLTYGGQKLEDRDLESLQNKLKKYGLGDVKIVVNQGFNFVTENENAKNKIKIDNQSSISKENLVKIMAFQDSMSKEEILSHQIFKELKSQNPNIKGFSINYLISEKNNPTKTTQKTKMLLVETDKKLSAKEKKSMTDYLKIRVNSDSAKIIINEN